MSYTVKLIDKKEVAFGTMAFFLEKPKGFSFNPGQYIILSLINPTETDEKGNSRAFSIASSNFDESIVIATRMTGSAYKKNLDAMATGTELAMEGPFGSLALKDEKPAVLLTGGIGITPFRSIILEEKRKGVPHRVHLFYSNTKTENAAFLSEFMKIESNNYTFVGTMTDDPQWKGETGFINKEMLEKYLHDLNGKVYYITGPPKMVEAMNKMLLDAGINKNDIRIEEFSGY
ncbi:MAG: FAD-dependent oxidoreductase [Candidatus Aenigmatarchaeota archaeon]